MKISRSRKSIGRSPLLLGLLLIPLALAWLALSPVARAVCRDGCFGSDTALGNDALPNNGGFFNTATGAQALFSNTDGYQNTATGYNALFSNTVGNYNTANGTFALYSNFDGVNNTAIGNVALYSNTTGHNNTASGVAALYGNTTGHANTATGFEALGRNTTGYANTATGQNALVFNMDGYYNTATGEAALLSNTTGVANTATGDQALLNSTTGSENTATGWVALANNGTGNYNTAVGSNALYSNDSGNDNTATGFHALYSNSTGHDNTATGAQALLSNTTGSNNIALGHGAGSNLTAGSNNIHIGDPGVAGESLTIRIGTQGTQRKTFVAGISGTALGSGMVVRVNASGQLGTAPSSVRFKQNIKPMDKVSEAIHALKPVIFNYKKELDPEETRQFGLVAEDVEKVNPDLVVRDKEGKPYTVRYEAVNAMLLNEFLKEHRKNEEQQATIASLQEQIEALAAGLRNVSAQLEMNEVPRVVQNTY